VLWRRKDGLGAALTLQELGQLDKVALLHPGVCCECHTTSKRCEATARGEATTLWCRDERTVNSFARARRHEGSRRLEMRFST
jgi:hypothetical protein